MELIKLDALFTASKKEIQKLAETNAQILKDNGDQNMIEQYCKARRLTEYLEAFTENIKKDVKEELNRNNKRLNFGTDELLLSNGRTTLDYMADQKYSELSEKLKNRKELLDLATKSKDDIYDSDGEKVEKLPVKSYSGDVLSLKIR